jgi:hypothetical protein
MKRKINFLIIGTPKGGTTTLAGILRMHPDIYIPERELLYFISDEYYDLGDKYLDSLYGRDRNERLMGGRAGLLLFMHQFAERVHSYNPKMKAIAILRHPVDRAYSAYWYARRMGWESCPTFEDALAHETERCNGSPQDRAGSYLMHGHYSEHIKHFLDVLGSENMRILMNEELKTNPKETIIRTLEWLELDPDIKGIDFSKKSNQGGLPRWQGIRRHIFTDESKLVSLVRKRLSPERREAIFFQVMKLIDIFNVRKGTRYPPMAQETRKRLVEYFRPWNKELSVLIGRDLEHWNR